MITYADPIERRDIWRDVWRTLTGDAILAVLCAAVALGLIAMLVLPQEPAAGTADPIAYSRWEAEAKLREGTLYGAFSALGLNSVAQTAWWRLALVAVGALAAVRLADRIARLVDSRRSRGAALRDERRLRVMLDAPPLPVLATALAAQRYRLSHQSDDALVADRAPLAEAVSIALHLGLVAMTAGLLMNLTVGWEALNRAVSPGLPATLRSPLTVALDDFGGQSEMRLLFGAEQQPLMLSPGQSGQAAGVDVALRQITPGYRLSATTGDAKPVMIRASNFVSPTAEVLVSFSDGEPERYVAVPEAGLALALSAGAAPDQPSRLRAFSMPAGEVLLDSPIQPEMTIAGATFRFSPARGAVIDARYQPGQPLVWLGLLLAGAGAIGSLFAPMRRIVVRHHGHWTEFYGSGRGAAAAVTALTAQPPDEAT